MNRFCSDWVMRIVMRNHGMKKRMTLSRLCRKMLAVHSLLPAFVLCFSLTCCAGQQETEKPDLSEIQLSVKAEEMIRTMTDQEKAAQLFVITPEALTGVSGVTAAGEITQNAFASCPVGGLIYDESNLLSWNQACQMLSSMNQISVDRTGLPAFLAVDEEGGNVRRVSGRLENAPYIPDMLSVGATQDPLQAYQAGSAIGGYLSRLGINVDFAPVADVLTNPENTVIGNRSFGSDPAQVAGMVALEVQGLREQGIAAALKHFPGHGNTSEDSHVGLAVSNRMLEELKGCEFLPFESGIDAGAEFVMAGHIVVPGVTEEGVPASLSHIMLTEILRGELGFQGIIVTDALSMGAVTGLYSSEEAAVQAILAGADLLLMPADFHAAYNAVLDAVENGTISRERLDESLRRIILLKLRMLESSSQEVMQAENIRQLPDDPGDESLEESQEGFIVEE